MDLAHIEVVAAKVCTHTIPSHATNTEPQNGLSMLAGLVAKSVTNYAWVEVCEERSLAWRDQNSGICSSVFFSSVRTLCAYICCIPLIGYPWKKTWNYWCRPSLAKAKDQRGWCWTISSELLTGIRCCLSQSPNSWSG